MRSSLFVREDEVMLENEFVNTQRPQQQQSTEQSSRSSKPPPPYPQQHSPQPKPHARREKPKPEEKDQLQEHLDVKDTSKLAAQLGADSSERLMEEQKEALRVAAMKKEMQEVRGALPPGESLNMKGQERELREYEENRNRDYTNMSSGGQPECKSTNHVYDEIPAARYPDTGGRPHQDPLSESRPPAPAQIQSQYYNQQYQGQPGMWAQPPSQQPGNMYLPPEQTQPGPLPPTTAGLDVNKPQAPPRRPSQPRSNLAYALQPGEATPHGFEKGSLVQLVGDPSRHGVIKWIGTLPEAKGPIAGVELVSSLVQPLF